MINENYTYDIKGNTVITTLSEYVQYITKLKNELEGGNEKVFFRGQANKNWDVRPSVFRGGILAVEHELIIEACARVPFEFGGHKSSFERLTKLQHYGLPTRLLDITMNPLVALYFACEICDDALNVKYNYEDELDDGDDGDDGDESQKEDPPTEVDGIIYYKKAYDYKYNSKEIDAISKLTEKNLNNGEVLIELIQTIWGDAFISTSDLHNPQKYKEFIDIIQKNYFVTSTFNNDRLIRQSGAFLVPGCFNVIENIGKYQNSIVQKAIDSLNKEFEKKAIIIPHNCKASILEELDFYNINKGSLFPELEHQMSYLRMVKDKYNKLTVGLFEKLPTLLHENIENTELAVGNDRVIDDTNIRIQPVINTYIEEAALRQGVLNIIRKAINYVDWHTKEAIISGMRSNIKRYLVSQKIETADASTYASKISSEIVGLYN